MQAMTLSIGKAGIEFFAQNLVANQLVAKLGTLVPPNSNPVIPDFHTWGFGWTADYSNIKIALTNGKLVNFTPVYTGVTQLGTGTPAGSQFSLGLSATNFTAQYDWNESYHSYGCYMPSGPGGFPSVSSRDNTKSC